MSRQYRIVNPEATDAEIEQLVESGETQVFSQAVISLPWLIITNEPHWHFIQLLSGGRSREANSVNAAVKARQQEIQKIESTLIELLTLFEQMAEQVVLDEAKFEMVEDNAVKVEEDIKQANVHLETGVQSARGARRKKWMCLGLGVGIVIIVVVVVAVVISVQNAGKGSTNTTNTVTTTAPPAATTTTALPAIRF